MPGYFVHLGSAPESVRSSELGLKGLIAPDLWKWNTPSKEEYYEFFSGCVETAPSYQQILTLCDITHGGTHFGTSQGDTNHADFTLLKSMFSNGELPLNQFMFGYIHHLRVDEKFYSRSDICDMHTFNKNYALDSQNAMDTLHLDWDKSNKVISEWYPEVVNAITDMPETVKNVVQFKDGAPVYISLNHLKEFMEDLRRQRSIDELLIGW